MYSGTLCKRDYVLVKILKDCIGYCNTEPFIAFKGEVVSGQFYLDTELDNYHCVYVNDFCYYPSDSVRLVRVNWQKRQKAIEQLFEPAWNQWKKKQKSKSRKRTRSGKEEY